MAKHIFYDARYVRTDFHDGISRYSLELGLALAAQTKVTFLICNEGQRALLPRNAAYILIHEPTSPKEPFTSLILNKYAPDIVFSPMQTMGSYGRQFKLVLTLHDLIYHRHRTPPHQLPPLLRAGWWLYHLTYIPQRKVLNGADLVATVSETSKQDILAARLTKRPMVVVSNAPQALQQYLKKPLDITKEPRHLVYMGSFMEYKNVETLIRGMADLPNYTLHLLSRISSRRKEQLSALVPSGAHIVFHNGVTDAEYATILADRALFVCASLDEGYGLPVAESSALGVPNVISDIAIFHEVAGDGAVYFDPTNPADFAQKVKEASVLSRYQALSKASLAQSKKFSWRASAKALLTAINSL